MSIVHLKTIVFDHQSVEELMEQLRKEPDKSVILDLRSTGGDVSKMNPPGFVEVLVQKVAEIRMDGSRLPLGTTIYMTTSPPSISRVTPYQ